VNDDDVGTAQNNKHLTGIPACCSLRSTKQRVERRRRGCCSRLEKLGAGNLDATAAWPSGEGRCTGRRPKVEEGHRWPLLAVEQGAGSSRQEEDREGARLLAMDSREREEEMSAMGGGVRAVAGRA
jgi:hypothetical protein